MPNPKSHDALVAFYAIFHTSISGEFNVGETDLLKITLHEM